LTTGELSERILRGPSGRTLATCRGLQPLYSHQSATHTDKAEYENIIHNV